VIRRRIPTSSDTTLVTSTAYGADGLPSIVTDPRGIAAETLHNLLGETTETIAAWDGTSSPTPTSDTNQMTLYTYDGDGNETSMTAVMPSGTPDQTTDYVYGVAGGTSGIFSNDLLAKVEYPNATTGAASTAASDDVSYTYDALGEETGMTDQNGNTHAYTRDVLGRQTLDAVTTLGSGVDGTVRALGTTYNAQGLPATETSYSNAGATTVVNQDQDVYNGLGQLTGEYQSVSGAVNTSSTPEVQYGYSDPSTGAVQTSMTYPNGRVVDDVYNAGIDATIGRVSALADAGGSAAGTLQGYTYQGLDTIVGNGDGNGVTETTTLDPFGRTAQMDYVNASSTSTDDFAYGYDRDGNVLYKNNLLDSGGSELYHANSAATGDNNSAYDPLNRLTGFQRGTLSSSGNNGSTLDTVASASASQSWSLNAVGDQSSVTTNGTTTTNSTNAKNELTTNGSNSLTYDNNGNETTDENGQTTTYDAWNRAIAVKNASSTTIANYSYDPTGRRITEASGGTTTDIYFTNQWQDIEEHQGGTVTRQNVWGLGYVNQLVERDDSSIPGNLGVSGSGLGERLYAQQDANWNVTALVGTSGNVVERMVYSPYGPVTFLSPSWAATTDAYAQNVLFQGGRLETATGNYIFQRRDYDPATGTWKQQDPSGYLDAATLYQLDRGQPTSSVDPLGLAANPLHLYAYFQHALDVLNSHSHGDCCYLAQRRIVLEAIIAEQLDIKDRLREAGFDLETLLDTIKDSVETTNTVLGRLQMLYQHTSDTQLYNSLPEAVKENIGSAAEVAESGSDVLEKISNTIGTYQTISALGHSLAGASTSSANTIDALGTFLDTASGFIPIPGISDLVKFYGAAVKAIGGAYDSIVNNEDVGNENLDEFERGQEPPDPWALLGPDWAYEILKDKYPVIAEVARDAEVKACGGLH
jgi:RHS repeat-associated protein